MVRVSVVEITVAAAELVAAGRNLRPDGNKARAISVMTIQVAPSGNRLTTHSSRRGSR
jgi:hypothetical protein